MLESFAREETVDDPANLVQRLLSEARVLLESSTEPWSPEPSPNAALKVWSKELPHLPYLLTRAEASMNADAETTYAFLTSVEGFKVIDPATTNHEDPPLKVISSDPRAEFILAKLEKPEVDIVVCNVHDDARRVFISKSIDLAVPGRSQPRAYNTFVIHTQPRGHGTCDLHLFNYLDLGPTVPPDVVNTIVAKQYFQQLHDKIVPCIEKRE